MCGSAAKADLASGCPGHLDVAFIGGEQAGQHLEQRRFAGPVGAAQRDEQAGPQRRRQRLRGRARAVALGEAGGAEHGSVECSGQTPSSAAATGNDRVPAAIEASKTAVDGPDAIGGGVSNPERSVPTRSTVRCDCRRGCPPVTWARESGGVEIETFTLT